MLPNQSPKRRSTWPALILLFLALPATGTAQEIELHYSDRMLFSWNDSGTGGSYTASFWQPEIPGGLGMFPMGHVAIPGYAAPSGMVIGRDVSGSAFAHPIGFNTIWTDSGSGGNFDGCFYEPLPPPGYVSLGSIGHNCSAGGPPPVTSIVCVRSDLAVQATVGDLIYNDIGTGAGANFSAWSIQVPDGAVDLGAFVGHWNYSQPTAPVWCLKESAVVPVDAPSPAELESLLVNHGPIIRFHPAEQYFPDDPAAVLDHPATSLQHSLVLNPNSYSAFNLTPIAAVGTSSTTILDDVQVALSDPAATLPEFKVHLNFPQFLPGAPNVNGFNQAESYVRVQPHQGVMTELQFWLFYPWNGPGKASVSCVDLDFNPTGPAGRHWSDWENVRVRVTNRNVWNPGVYELINVALSRHSQDVEVPEAGLEIIQGSPVIYAGEGSHAHYPAPGQHTYETPSSTDVGVCTVYVSLYDLTGHGAELHTYAPQHRTLVSSAWPSLPVSTPDWFYFTGQWGNYERQSFCVNDIVFGELYCFEQVENGKAGMLQRSELNVPVPLNADLGSLRPSAGTLTPAFDPSITAYNSSVPLSTTSLQVALQAMNDAADIELTFNGVSYTMPKGSLLGQQTPPIPLNIGVNMGTITVTVSPTVSRTYTWTVTRDTQNVTYDVVANDPVGPSGPFPVGDGVLLVVATNDVNQGGRGDLNGGRVHSPAFAPDLWFRANSTPTFPGALSTFVEWALGATPPIPWEGAVDGDDNWMKSFRDSDGAVSWSQFDFDFSGAGPPLQHVLLHVSRSDGADLTLAEAVTASLADMDMDGFTAAEDCDDTNPNVYPGAPEICGNGVDENCDGFDLSCTTPIGTNYCAAAANSTGSPASISAFGSENLQLNSVVLTASGLPVGSFGHFVTSRTQNFVMNPGGSSGNLCLGGAVGRYVGPGQIVNSGLLGTFSLALDVTNTPLPTGSVSINAGETWNYQAWYRDAVLGIATSNFTDGIQIDYR